jgi:hypothetical protein
MSALTKFLLDGMDWSFSRVRSYEQCPKQFDKVYMKAGPKAGNAFAEWGSWCHELLERYYKGELEIWELSSAYYNGYAEHVRCSFPLFNKKVDMDERYFVAGAKYFENFEDVFGGCEVVAVEQQVRLEIAGRPFIGYIDLVLRDKDGSYIICDHKSKSKFKSKTELTAYLRQLYLYSIYVKDRYGVYPKWLVFNMFRAHTVVRKPFKREALQEAIQWFMTTIDRIYEDETYAASPDQFYCDNLCDVRESCVYSKEYEGGDDDAG